MKDSFFQFFVIAILFIGLGFYIGFAGFQKSDMGAMQFSQGRYFNLIGTSTSSPSVLSQTIGATTTDVVRVGDSVNIIDFVVHASTASSSEMIYTEFFASNDNGCEDYNNSANWFPAVPEAGSVTAMVQAGEPVVSLAFTPGADNKSHNVQFKDWNARCLRVDTGNASSTIWTYLIAKEL